MQKNPAVLKITYKPKLGPKDYLMHDGVRKFHKNNQPSLILKQELFSWKVMAPVVVIVKCNVSRGVLTFFSFLMDGSSKRDGEIALAVFFQ